MENRFLCRGKMIGNGEWVEGFLVPFAGDDKNRFWQIKKVDDIKKPSISQTVRVNPSTICQCTGLKDKKGKLIWENDIVKDLFSDTAAPIRYGSYQSCFDSTKVEHVGFYVDWSGKYNKNYRKDLGYWIHMVDAEVIGNAIDNPELLEV